MRHKREGALTILPWEVPMRKILSSVIVVCALLTLACGGKKVIVGVVLPESGVVKAYGPSLKAGIKLAFDDAIAKDTPKNIEARYRDSWSNPEVAAKEAAELFKGGAVIVIGGATSEEAKALIPEAERANGVVISPSASEPGLAASSNLFFRVYPPDDVEGVVAATFLVVQKKTSKVLVCYQRSFYADGMLPVFSNEVTKLGGTVTDRLPIGPSDWDKAIVEALTTQKPDAVFICAYGEETLATLSLLRTNNFAGTICTSSAVGTGDLIRRAGPLAEGIYVARVRLELDSSQEPIKSFVGRFKAANKGAMPDLYAAHGYDAAMVALAALADPQPKDNTELLQRLMNLGGKRGVTGPMSFDDVGNTTHRPRMHCVRSGKFEDCDPSPVS
jgi:branched-chain amino acid transport system substrate-binding protein